MIRLDLPSISDDELPYVSIVVPTQNRHHFFELVIRNWNAIDYPRNKLEMIILDSSDSPYTKQLPTGIHYTHTKKKLTIGKKRNSLVSRANYNYIVHMDDDDWYPAESVVCRIRTMLHERKECFGCQTVNCLDLVSNQMFEAVDKSVNKAVITVSESTMAYTKKFWNAQKWDDQSTITECLPFIKGRIDSICTAPSSFIVMQLSHDTNTVNRRVHQTSLSTQLNSNIFQKSLSVYDSAIFNKIRSVIIMNIKGYKEAVEAINNNADYNQLSDSLKSNPLIVEYRRRTMPAKSTSSGKDIVYYCGPGQLFNFSCEWCPDSNQLGGSEEAVIGITTLLAQRGYNVTVYCVLCGSPDFYNGVRYEHHYTWNPLDKQDVTIIWRDPTNLNQQINSTKLLLDLHDVIPIEVISQVPKSTVIMTKSAFHNQICAPIMTDFIPNGIRLNVQVQPKPKTKGLMVCTSSPDRCLVALLRMMPLIRAKIPHAEIHWAYGFKSGISHGGMEENPITAEWVSIQKELIKNTPGFKDLGRLSQSEINELYSRADLFIYPTRFPEIDCISLTKAMAAGCIPIVTPSGAMADKIGSDKQFSNDHFKIDYSLEPGKQFDEFVEVTIHILSNSDKFDRNLIKKKAEEYSIEKVVDKWIEKFND
jgi:glycosyltransferase involved in cell wall biosynthesis